MYLCAAWCYYAVAVRCLAQGVRECCVWFCCMHQRGILVDSDVHVLPSTWIEASSAGLLLLTCCAHVCRFRGPVCPDWLQEQLLSWMIESAERGRPGFRDMLTMTPCDLFSLIRGRTLWLMGDSMMQVRPMARLYYHRLHMHDACPVSRNQGPC